jgi:hypothetical protein
MTEEHLWSEWMHPYLPQLMNAKVQAGRQIVRRGKIMSENMIRPGHVFTKRFRLVCKRCNTGWMSGVETDVKRILIPLLQGQPIMLRRGDRKKLAIWIALKVMVAECIDPSDAVLDQFARDDFKMLLKIPRQLKIWIGKHDLPNWYTGFWHRTLLANLNPEFPQSGFKNIQTTTFGIGHLFVFSFATTLSQFNLNPGHIYRDTIRQLWPLVDTAIGWPPPALSNDDAGNLAGSLAHVMSAPFAQWRGFPL